MFNFKNISKFFSYNWSTLFKSILPKGNKTKMEESELKNISNGSILRIIGVILNKIAVIGIAVYLVVNVYKAFYGSDVIAYAFNEAFKASVGKWILEILGAIIIPVGIFIYTRLMKDKEQNGWPIFIIFIISVVHTFYYVYLLISFFINFLVNPLFAFMGLASIFLAFLGNIHISVGCIDFLQKQNDAYNKKEPNTNTQTTNPSTQQVQATETEQVQSTETQATEVQQTEPVQPTVEPVAAVEQPQATETPSADQTPETNNNSGETTIYCSSCGAQISSTSAFCSNCGNKINQ